MIENANEQTQTGIPGAGAAPSGAAPKKGLPWNFHQADLIPSKIAAGVGGEYFTKTRDALIEIFKAIADGVETQVIGLNRENNPALRFSAMIVVCRMKDINPNAVAFHTLILEATGDKLGSVQRNLDNQQVRVNRVTGDAYDEILFKTALSAVQETYKNAHVYNAQSMVIPTRITPDKKETLIEIARNAAMACVSLLMTVGDGFRPLNLAEMDRDCRLVIDIAVGNQPIVDCTGAPNRASVVVSTTSQQKTANTQQQLETVNIQENVVPVCKVAGFMNPIWAPMEQQFGIGFGAYAANPNQPRQTQTFASEFVITSLQSAFATSPAAVLFAVAQSLALTDNDNWIQTYLPNQSMMSSDGGSGGRVDITDIGALNITANLGREEDKGGFGSPLDTSGMRRDLVQMNKYLVSLFRPGLMVSIDCPEAGPQTWYTSPIAAMASGDMDAYNQIFQGFNELTNGMFGEFFKHGSPMSSNIIRVPLGHYMLDGQLKDIRDIDYTAIANLFAKNPTVIHDYSNTFIDRPGVSSLRNLSIREGIIMHALNEQAEITGYAARVTLSDELLSAASKAIAACNLPTIINTPLNADQLRSGVAAPSFIGGAITSNTRTFGNNNYGGQARQMYRFGSFGRR